MPWVAGAWIVCSLSPKATFQPVGFFSRVFLPTGLLAVAVNTPRPMGIGYKDVLWVLETLKVK